MRSAILATLSTTTILLIGCAVDASAPTARENAEEASASHRDPSAEITVAPAGPISPTPHVCYNAPLTFEPAVSCGSFFSYATTPDTTYASCGMTSATFSPPPCAASSGSLAWDVIPGGAQNLQSFAHLTPAVCEMYYADMELWTQSATTGKWAEIASGRRYATPYTSSGEQLCSPAVADLRLHSARRSVAGDHLGGRLWPRVHALRDQDGPGGALDPRLGNPLTREALSELVGFHSTRLGDDVAGRQSSKAASVRLG